MEKHSGRHRKRRQGWAERLCWMLGALLALVFCSPLGRGADPASPTMTKPLPPKGVGAGPAGIPEPSRQASDGPEVPRPRQSRSGGGTIAVPRPREPRPEERGWCVDDDGVRGVRPYVFKVPQAQGNTCGPGTGQRSPGAEKNGEFAELASAVRIWLDMRA